MTNYSRNSEVSKDFTSLFNGFSGKSENTGKTTFEKMKVSEIRLDPAGEFQKLFPMNETELQNITLSMSSEGFHKFNPLILVTIQSEEDSVNILGDGHTRLEAAKNAGIDEVTVYRTTFETRKQAKQALLQYQLYRRNLTAGEKAKYLEILDSVKKPGIKNKENKDESKGKSAEKMAQLLGCSTRTVENMRSVNNSGERQIIDAMQNNEISPSAAARKVKEKKENPDDEPSDATDDNSSPRPLAFSHESTMEIPDFKPSDETEFELEKKRSFKKGFTAGATETFFKILDMLKEGMNAEEIENSEIFNQMTFDLIASKLNYVLKPKDYL